MPLVEEMPQKSVHHHKGNFVSQDRQRDLCKRTAVLMIVPLKHFIRFAVKSCPEISTSFTYLIVGGESVIAEKLVRPL